MKKIISGLKNQKVVYFSSLSMIFSIIIISITQNNFLKIQVIFSLLLILYLNKYLFIIIFKK